MAFAGISYLAIILAALASFMFGGLWYGVLSDKWLAAAGKSKEDIDAGYKIGGVQWQLPFTFLLLLVISYFMAGVLGHLGAGQVSLWNGLVTGLFIWLGFVLPTMAINHAYQGPKPFLTLIDGGHWLFVFLIQGAVIGGLGV